MDLELFGLIAPDLPAVVIILIIEHIAIAKSFGRIFGYTVIPSQEILAQGAANVLSPFVGGYTCTGSFGASAVLSKAGVRTPLAGLFSALVLVLALYALTPVFYYIPNAALAGLIIHATCNLITPPRNLWKYWMLSPLELVIWIIGVALALCVSLEVSIYTTTGLSFVILLIRLARTSGQFAEKTSVHRVVRDDTDPTGKKSDATRDIYLPTECKAAHNPNIKVVPVYPGVFIYRFAENLTYANQAQNMDHLLRTILTSTRRTTSDDGVPLKDRLWSDAPPPSKTAAAALTELPLLRAVILDLSAVNVVDITSIQGLIDLRNTLDRYAAPEVVEWHFAGVYSRWTRRALAVTGFGYPSIKDAEKLGNWCPAYTVATSLAGATEDDVRRREVVRLAVQGKDEERKRRGSGFSANTVRRSLSLHGKGARVSREFERPGNGGVRVKDMEMEMERERVEKVEALFGIERPFFHVDLVDAVQTAVRDARRADEKVSRTEVSSVNEDERSSMSS